MDQPGAPRNYRTLLGSLCTLGLIYPLLDPGWAGYPGLVAWTSVFWVVLYLAIKSLREGRTAWRVDVSLFVLATALGAVALVFGIEHDPDSLLHRVLSTSANLVSLALLLHVTSAILRDVLAKGRVDANRIWGAVCVYILIGLIWAFLYGLLSLAFDDCLVMSREIGNRPALDDAKSLATRLYFSFVTLTTVGYGDIAPGNIPTRLIATVEAVVGQLYLTILVARLVGLHITHSHTDRSGRSAD